MTEPGGTAVVPHMPEECYGSRLHCYWHGLDEDDTGEYFMACYECKHVYQTEADLLAALDEAWPGHPFVPGASIYACAFCGHDF